MKLYTGILLSLLLGSGIGLLASGMDQKIASSSAIKQVKEADLKDIAETQQYGYKAANLQLLEGLAEIFNALMNGQEKTKKPYQVVVPKFVPISSFTIQKFLRQHGVDLAAIWPKVVPTKAFQDEALAQRKLPAGFVKKLETEIVSKIRAAFENVKNDANNVLLLPDQKAELLEKLLMQAAKDNRRLMVRSTGKEDTMELANAGGNETVANVIPQVRSLLGAISAVIASYFSEKSLVQRLGAGDKTIFDLPMTPVLVQEMVGEATEGISNNDAVPRCGVMFTEEPEGGLSRETNYKKTSGIAVIQASYGHNEGVVNSIVAVDTYYTIPGVRWFPVIRPKPFRVRPDVKSGMLRREDNPKSLVRRGALTEEEVLILSYFGMALEKFYGRPMDVEFVIDRANKRVAIVQARPIVHPLERAVPCYITKPDPEALRGEVIGSAGGEVRIVSLPEQCLVAKTIGEALSRYQAEGFDRKRVRCVCIGEHAPSTSHEATTFRSEGKPVLFVSNYQLITPLVQKSKSVLVDTQRGFLQRYLGAATSREQLLKEGVITLGWAVYPIPAMMSVLPRLKRLIVQKTSNMWSVAVQQAVLFQNEAYIKKAQYQVLSEDKECADRQSLLLQRFVDALYYQQVADEIVFGFSLLGLRKGYNIAEKHSKGAAKGPFSEYARAYNMLAEQALTPELGAAWKKFVANQLANASPNKQEKFGQMIASLYRLGGLEMWFNMVFAKGYTLDELLAGYSKQDELFLQTLGKQKELIKSTNLEGLADPKKFEKVWNNFLDSIVSYFVSPSSTGFLAQFKQAGETGRILALVVMRDLVDLFDDGLKIMSRSPEYQIIEQPDTSKSEQQRIVEDRDKGFVFKKMLSKNLEVLQRWLALYQGLSQSYDDRFDFTSNVKVETAKDVLDDLAKQLKVKIWGTKKHDFEPGVYNVQEGMLGAKTLWSRSRPQSLENLFTFIHQSQLALLAALNQKVVGALFELLSVPEVLKTINEDYVLKMENELDSHPQVIGFLFEHGALHLNYNWAQRNHSANIEVVFAPPADVFFTFSMFGASGIGGKTYGRRWADFLNALEQDSLKHWIFPLKTELSERGFSITWKLLEKDVEKNFKKVKGWLQKGVDELLSNSERGIKYSEETRSVPLDVWVKYKYIFCGEDCKEKLSREKDTIVKSLAERLLNDSIYIENSIDAAGALQTARLTVEVLSELLKRENRPIQDMNLLLQKRVAAVDRLFDDYLALYYFQALASSAKGTLKNSDIVSLVNHALNIFRSSEKFKLKRLLVLFDNYPIVRTDIIKEILNQFGVGVDQVIFPKILGNIVKDMKESKDTAILQGLLLEKITNAFFVDLTALDTVEKRAFFSTVFNVFLNSGMPLLEKFARSTVEQAKPTVPNDFVINALGKIYKSFKGSDEEREALAKRVYTLWKDVFIEDERLVYNEGIEKSFNSFPKKEVAEEINSKLKAFWAWPDNKKILYLEEYIKLLNVLIGYGVDLGSNELLENVSNLLKNFFDFVGKQDPVIRAKLAPAVGALKLFSRNNLEEEVFFETYKKLAEQFLKGYLAVGSKSSFVGLLYRGNYTNLLQLVSLGVLAQELEKLVVPDEGLPVVKIDRYKTDLRRWVQSLIKEGRRQRERCLNNGKKTDGLCEQFKDFISRLEDIVVEIKK